MTPPWRYLLGGVVVESELRFPSLPAAPPAREPASPGADQPQADQPQLGLVLAPRAARLERGVASWLVERTLPGAAAPYLRVAGDPSRYLLVHGRGIDLEVIAGTRIEVTHLDPSLDGLELEHLLVDQLLPLVIGRLGRLSLHGSAVAWAAGAIAFLGNSGAGKSTLAAGAVAREGARFLADDQVVLEPTSAGFVAHPSYPSARLWNDSAASLFGRAPRDLLEHGTSKLRVELPTAQAPVPLRGMVLLERGPCVTLEALRPQQALVGIAQHVDRLDPTDRSALRAELELLSRVSESATVWRLVMTDDLGRIGEGLTALRAAIGDAPRSAG